MEAEIFTSSMQYGFAGFCAILMGVIVWLIRRLLDVLNQTNTVVADNTNTIRDLGRQNGEEFTLLRSLYDRLLTRPCLREDR